MSYKNILDDEQLGHTNTYITLSHTNCDNSHTQDEIQFLNFKNCDIYCFHLMQFYYNDQ